MIQEKVVRTIAELQSLFLMSVKIVQLYQKGKASQGQITLAKGYASKIVTQAARVAREVMGGNGILIENYAMKAIMDLETGLTGEGTYEMNVLVTGKELTGLAAYF